VYTTEIYPGRAQEFQYITDAQADQERAKRAAEREKKANANKASEVGSPTVAEVPKPN